ncbi:MAG: PaaI family thioesterase [Muribaculaceae bacterium]
MKKITNPWVDAPGYRCIGCCPTHPFGFHLEFFEDGDDIVSTWKPTPDFQGWIDTLHGGVQALLLDEICGWTVAHKVQTAGVTSRMETHYLRPISTTEPIITIRGRITAQRRNIITLEATLANSAGEVCTRAVCTYFALPVATAEAMQFRHTSTTD